MGPDTWQLETTLEFGLEESKIQKVVINVHLNSRMTTCIMVLIQGKKLTLIFLPYTM